MTQATTLSHAAKWIHNALRNWRLYCMDGLLLGLFMISACAFVALVEHRASPVRSAISSPLVRRALIGSAMGLTAVCLIYSPWGKRSGAQMNPAVTLSFWRLGRMTSMDAVGYVAGQFIGGMTAVALMAVVFGYWVRDASVNYVATQPGPFHPLVVWLAEFAIALLMMSMVMAVNKVPRLAPYTGCFAGLLVAIYITFEAPISGMSLNPARTFSSAVNAGQWAGWWIYFSAPVAGMLAGVQMHLVLGSSHKRLCGKLNHSRHIQCHIRCNCMDHGAA